MRTYRTVRIPEKLVETVQKLIEENKELGYSSHSAFIIGTVRKRVEQIIKNNTENDIK